MIPPVPRKECTRCGVSQPDTKEFFGLKFCGTQRREHMITTGVCKECTRKKTSESMTKRWALKRSGPESTDSTSDTLVDLVRGDPSAVRAAQARARQILAQAHDEASESLIKGHAEDSAEAVAERRARAEADEALLRGTYKT